MFDFLYLIRPTRPAMLTDGMTAAEQSAMGQHFAYLQAGVAAGTVILAGRTQTTGPETVGICIFKAGDLAAAKAFAAADPGIAAGVVSVEVLPFKVALMAGA